MKKLYITLFMLVLITSLFGCSKKETLGEQVNNMMSTKENIEISVKEKIYNEEKEELTWEELDQLKNYEELRDIWEDQMNVVRFDRDSKNGAIYIDENGNWTGNSTLLNAFKNKEFVKNYWRENSFKNEISKKAIELFSDITNNSTGSLASVNAYFNILPANGDNTSGLMNYLSRKEVMTAVLRADTPVHMLEENEKYNDLFGYTDYNKYAALVEDNCYLTVKNNGLNAYTYNTVMTRAEAIYLLVQRYYKEEYDKLKNINVNFNDCSNGGDILKDNKITESYAPEMYSLQISLMKKDNKLDKKLYKALVVAYNKGIIDKDTRWNEGIKYGELLNMIIKTYESMYDYSNYPVNAKVGNNDGTKLYDKEVVVIDKDTQDIGNVTVGTIKLTVEEILEKYKSDINMPEKLLEELKVNSEVWEVEELDMKLKVHYCEYLNLRTGPTTDYPIMKSLKKGTEVHVVARCKENGWCLIISQGYVGFQHGSYLAEL